MWMQKGRSLLYIRRERSQRHWMQKGRNLLYIYVEKDDNTRLQKGRSLLYIHVEKDDNTLGKEITSCECKKDVAYSTSTWTKMTIQGYNVMWMQKGRSLLYIHVDKDDNTRL